eukprot:12168639-Ditylum_brightwellii.AAC.1
MACTARLHMEGKLRTGLKKMKTHAPPCIPREELGDLLSAAVADQHELGWDNLVKGRISKDWGLAQEAHFNTFSPNLTQNTKPQNDALHRSSCDPDSTSHLNKQIHNAYGTLQHQMDAFDQHLFNKPLNNWHDTTPQSKQHWLAAVHIAVNDFTE